MEPFGAFMRHVRVEPVAGDETLILVPDPAPDTDLATLYLRERDAMVRYARMLTGSAAVAEEVVQEAFLKLHRRAEQPQNPTGYLRATVVNLCRSSTRRLRLERRLSPDHRLVLQDPEIDETWAAVCRLPFRERAVLALRFYEDLTEADIARVLGCRLGTVKSSLHRGLATLRKELS
jgi:RNA polymerase sigma factor (sigma-70 family)